MWEGADGSFIGPEVSTARQVLNWGILKFRLQGQYPSAPCEERNGKCQIALDLPALQWGRGSTIQVPPGWEGEASNLQNPSWWLMASARAAPSLPAGIGLGVLVATVSPQTSSVFRCNGYSICVDSNLLPCPSQRFCDPSPSFSTFFEHLLAFISWIQD